MRARVLPLGVAIVLALPLVGGSPQAFAAASCSFDGTALTVTLPLQDDAARFQQGTGTDAGMILANGARCSPTAPIASTATIAVTGGPWDQAVIIDLLDADGEPVDWGDVDWSVNLGTGDEDRGDLLRVDGASRLTIGTEGIDLETDGDLDVVFDRMEELLVTGTSGDDVVSAAGDATTGDPLVQDIDVTTYHGHDTLIGGDGDDFLDALFSSGRGPKRIFGGGGDDQLWSGRGSDIVVGGEGDDILVGYLGADTLRGSDGDDFARGGIGDDRLLGGVGNDVLKGELGSDELRGGPGADRCRGGRGSDRILGCEEGTGSGRHARPA